MKTLPLTLLALAALCSCTWVKVTEKGSSVAVANAANVRGCENLREVTVSVTSKVGFYKRDADKVATELTNLARNEAVADGGDTIVPSSLIENGRQSFNVYKCNKR
jgi:hypothetical protein